MAINPSRVIAGGLAAGVVMNVLGFLGQGVMLGKRNTPGINDVVVKTSAGAAHFLPIARADDLAAGLNRMRNAGLTVIGLDEEGAQIYSDLDLTEPLVIVIGNEGQGISSDVAAVCDRLVSIPMFGKISSLNASVAAGIVFFEAVRQRHLVSR